MASEKGFRHKAVDDLIIERLKQQPENTSIQSLEDVAKWLGQPSEPTFREREAEYLALERTITEELIAELGDDGWNIPENTVIDTTGSAIYLGDSLMSALAKRSRIVYLAIPESEYEFMYQQYYEDPKPVIWGTQYEPRAGESAEETMRRCYPELITWRAAQYKKYSDMMMIMDRKNRDRMSISRFLRLAGAK